MSAAPGRLVVISGPSGAGKTSVCRELKRLSSVVFSVSATTRPERSQERDGVDYWFLARDEFEHRVEAGEFLEWASYNGHLYGTLRGPMQQALDDGKVYLLEIEVAGTRQLRQGGVDGLYVFIEPPSLAELRRRLVDRGSNALAEIEQRVRIAEDEMRAAREDFEGQSLYDVTIVNEDLKATIGQVKELIGT